MADWSKWGLTDTYSSIDNYDDEKDKDAVRLNDTRVTSATNLPDYSKRWNETLGTFQNWLSSVWANIVLAIAGGGTGAITAAGARSNLSVPSVSEAQATAQGLVDTHAALTSPHGAVSAATANKLILRDSEANASVAYPAAGDHIANVYYVNDAGDYRVAAHQALFDAHGAVSAATASRLMIRNTLGRAQVTNPESSQDIANKGYVDGLIAYGTYTPNLNNYANIDASTAYPCQYLKVGNVVTVSGRIQIDPNTISVLANLIISLPISSSFTSIEQAAGVAAAAVPGNDSAFIAANSPSNTVIMYWYPSHSYNTSYMFTFTYRIL